jgi:hypothetical protein
MLRYLACLALLSLTLPGPGSTQQRPNVRLGGFIGSTLYLQDGDFGPTDGQGALWAAPRPVDDGGILYGGDVRNTRLTVRVDGPAVAEGWSVSGVVETDFFGMGAAGTSAIGESHPRLRLAYADLRRGSTTFRLGQSWTPFFGHVPASVSHLAFPLGYGSAGVVGARYPGLFVYQDLGTTAGMASQFQVAAFHGVGMLTPDDGTPATRPGAVPQVEARLDLSGSAAGVPWSWYVAGHADHQERPAENVTGLGFAVGARAAPGPLTLHGNLYQGRALGHQLGHLSQIGDISGWGAWGQAGMAIAENWSAWLFFGLDDPDDDDVRTEIPGDGRLRNQTTSALVRYSMGPYALGVEWMQARTDWALQGSPLAETTRRTANQFALSVFYAF